MNSGSWSVAHDEPGRPVYCLDEKSHYKDISFNYPKESMTEITLAPAIELAQRVKRKEISAVELLELHLQRYRQHNPIINAVIFT